VSSDHARRIGTTALAFHDPLVLFGFLSGYTRKIGFATGVLILAQRQAALVAKQAASLDELCGGRFRLGVGVGWNEIEFQGLGMDFHSRGRRSEEQVRFMQALWAEPHTTFHGDFHHLDNGGLTLRPKSGRVPVWFGGHAEATLRRTAKYGDGYMPLAYAPGDGALATFAKLRALIREAGRKPEDVGLEVWVFAWRRQRGGLAAGNHFLEEHRCYACDCAHDLRQRASPTHQGTKRGRASGGPHTLSLCCG